MEIRCLFFKYCDINVNTLSSLATGQVWFSPRSQLNDPFDCAPILIWDIDERQLDELLASFNATLVGQPSYEVKKELVERSLFQFIDECGVFCVSRTPCDELMWAHYGASHRGVAIGFGVKRENISNQAAPYKSPRPIQYNGRGQARMSNFYKARLKKTGSDEAFANLIQAIYFSKNPAWSYEQEERFLSLRKKGLLELDASICMLVYGAQAAVEHIALVQKLISESVQQYQIKICEKGLAYVPIGV